MKFRAWGVKEQKWVSHNILVDFSGNTYWVFGDVTNIVQERGEYIIERFTGLYDKNGKEIYEGDILNTGYIVVMMGGAVLVKKGEKIVPELWKKVEVIGNIHQNNPSCEATK